MDHDKKSKKTCPIRVGASLCVTHKLTNLSSFLFTLTKRDP